MPDLNEVNQKLLDALEASTFIVDYIMHHTEFTESNTYRNWQAAQRNSHAAIALAKGEPVPTFYMHKETGEQVWIARVFTSPRGPNNTPVDYVELSNRNVLKRTSFESGYTVFQLG